jgi:hypothetical protein
MAALLDGFELPEEKLEALLQACLWLSKALGIENHIEEPMNSVKSLIMLAPRVGLNPHVP